MDHQYKQLENENEQPVETENTAILAGEAHSDDELELELDEIVVAESNYESGEPADAATEKTAEDLNEVEAGNNDQIKAKEGAPAVLMLGGGNDGVFSNISAKPDIPPKPEVAAPAEDGENHPPAYSQVEAEPVPPYPAVAVLISGAHEALTVENRPAGNLVVFFITVCVSFTFQFIGLLLCLIFCQTHAGRLGARAGFGIALVQYGMIIRNKSLGYHYDDNGYLSDSRGQNEDSSAAFLSYVIMLLGWFVTFHATGEYFRVRRVEQLMNAQSSAVV